MRWVLLFILAGFFLSKEAHAFSTKKVERKGGPVLAAAALHSSSPFVPEPETTSPFIHSAAVGQYVVIEEEETVSTGTAAIACLLTMAIGFGLGYGT